MCTSYALKAEIVMGRKSCKSCEIYFLKIQNKEFNVLHLMLLGVISKPHKTYKISPKYTAFWKKKKYIEGRNCCGKKKFLSLKYILNHALVGKDHDRLSYFFFGLS